jgi:hypothetical protein
MLNGRVLRELRNSNKECPFGEFVDNPSAFAIVQDHGSAEAVPQKNREARSYLSNEDVLSLRQCLRVQRE